MSALLAVGCARRFRIDHRKGMATRHAGYPTSNGPLEEFFHQVDRNVGDRAAC